MKLFVIELFSCSAKKLAFNIADYNFGTIKKSEIPFFF